MYQLLLTALLRRHTMPDNLLSMVTNHVNRLNRQANQRFYRATITAAGGISKTVKVRRTGESASDDADVPVPVSYTSSTLGATGGPAIGDDVLVEETSPGNPVIRGKFA